MGIALAEREKIKRVAPAEDLNTYLSAFPKVPLLEPQETIALGRLLRGTINDLPGWKEDWKTIKALGVYTVEEARHHLILANTRLVVAEAIRYSKRAPTNITVMDLISEGLFGLFDAARRFDPERPCKFSTYATWWIRRYIRKALTGTRIIRIPYYMNGIISKLPWVEARLAAKLGKKPTTAEIAEEMDCKESDLLRTVNTIGTTKVFNVQSETSEGDPLKTKEDVRDEGAEKEYSFNQAVVWESLKRMEPEQCFIIMLRYGFIWENLELVQKMAAANGWEFEVKKKYTFSDVGEIFQVSREKARALERDSTEAFLSVYLVVSREMQ